MRLRHTKPQPYATVPCDVCHGKGHVYMLGSHVLLAYTQCAELKNCEWCDGSGHVRESDLDDGCEIGDDS